MNNNKKKLNSKKKLVFKANAKCNQSVHLGTVYLVTTENFLLKVL